MVAQFQRHPPPSVCWLHLKTSSSPSLSSLSGYSGPLVNLVFHHPPVTSSQSLCFWSVLTSSLFTSYEKEAQAVRSPATLTALTGCYGLWSLFCWFKWLGNNALSLMQLPHHSLLARMHSLAKMPSSSLLTMARVHGSDKLVSSNLICRIKVGNDHGQVTHSAWVPSYSTQLLISKLEIMIVWSIDLSTLVKSSHITIHQKDHVFGHVLSPPWYHDAFLYHT